MSHAAEILRVRALSDDDLVLGLNGLLSSGRRLTALLVTHLGEVDARRLHLHAGHPSLFAYCTDRLGMSEDEAYRRIEVARLARGRPILLDMLAAGRISLSVAALLKPYLTGDNHDNEVALLEAMCGKTVRQAREVLAAWFPRADVPTSIRKLPAPRGTRATQRSAKQIDAGPPAEQTLSSGVADSPAQDVAPTAGRATHRNASAAEASAVARRADAMIAPAEVSRGVAERGKSEAPDVPTPGPAAAAKDRSALAAPAAAASEDHVAPTEDAAARGPEPEPIPPGPAAPIAGARRNQTGNSRCIEPLSPGRYRVQLTASAELKRKLELARDLLRHAIPDGDLAALLERAVDLLIEQTLQRRFAVKGQQPVDPAPIATRAPCAERNDTSTSPDGADTHGSRHIHDPKNGAATPPDEAAPQHGKPDGAGAATDEIASREGPRPPASRHIPNHVRRAVLARDGLRCAWVGPDGTRCDSQAWLEHDHITPRGQGGDNGPSNIRLFCKPHNRLSAELAYGGATIARIIRRRRGRGSQRELVRHPNGEQDPPEPIVTDPSIEG